MEGSSIALTIYPYWLEILERGLLWVVKNQGFGGLI